MYSAQFVEALKDALNGLRTIHSVGEEWCSYIGKIPVGGVPYCGQEVTRSTYSALWSYAQSQGLVKSESEWQSIYSAKGGNVPFYSSGDGSATFRMPRLVGYVRGASGQSEAGAYVKEGLPNIVGSLVGQKYAMLGEPLSSILSSGALSASGTGTKGTGQTESSYARNIHFDASESNSIYGMSDHVTPETCVVLFGVFAFGEVGSVEALDAGTLASALARVESNIETRLPSSSIHIVESWQDGTEWYNKYSNGFVEQGGFVAGTGTDKTVSLLVEMRDLNYTPMATSTTSANNNANGDWYLRVESLTSTTFVVTSYLLKFYWVVKGYAK